MLERGSDVIEALEQDLFARRCDLEGVFEALVVVDRLMGQVHVQAVGAVGLGAPEELVDFRVFQNGRKDAVLEAVVVKDVGVTGGKNDAEAVIADGPGGVFAAGTAAKVRSSKEYRGALVFRPVEDEIRIGGFAREFVAPVVEENSAKALAREGLEELFGHHLVGVDVDAIEGKNQSAVGAKGFHSIELLLNRPLTLRLCACVC